MPAGRTTVARAKAKLLEWVAEHAPAGGELLPGERTLAALLSLHRGTLRGAIALAVAEGRFTREGSRLVVAASRRKSAPGGSRGADAPTKLLARSVVVVLPPIDLDRPDMKPWQRYVTLGATEAVRETGRHAIAVNGSTMSPEDISALVAVKPAGVLMSHFDASATKAFAAARVPIVVYGDAPAHAQFDRVFSDQELGCYELTRTLIAEGRRPARFWRKPWDNWWLSARSRGYARAMTEADLAPLPLIEFAAIPTHAISKEAFDASSRLLVGQLIDLLRGPHRVDALLVTSDRDAFYAAAAVKLLGLTPGRDVVIAGYDNYWPLCEERQFCPDAPRLTVDKQNERTGREMMNLLAERIGGKGGARAIVRKVPPTIVGSAS
jgi:DNA-binding LacI/PurR family transcriptional regulator